MVITEELLEAWAKRLSQEKDINIKWEDIFYAVFILYGDAQDIEWAGDTWDIKLDNGTYKLLQGFNFTTITNPATTDFDDLQGIMLYYQKVKVKAAGAVWYIHRYDADPFPSNPHAHNAEQNVKLDLSNGKCYGRKLI